MGGLSEGAHLGDGHLNSNWTVRKFQLLTTLCPIFENRGLSSVSARARRVHGGVNSWVFFFLI